MTSREYMYYIVYSQHGYIAPRVCTLVLSFILVIQQVHLSCYPFTLPVSYVSNFFKVTVYGDTCHSGCFVKRVLISFIWKNLFLLMLLRVASFPGSPPSQYFCTHDFVYTKIDFKQKRKGFNHVWIPVMCLVATKCIIYVHTQLRPHRLSPSIFCLK